jgi:hypothetical protein
MPCDDAGHFHLTHLGMNTRILNSRKRIAMVAHDNKKAELIEWAIYNKTYFIKASSVCYRHDRCSFGNSVRPACH